MEIYILEQHEADKIVIIKGKIGVGFENIPMYTVQLGLADMTAV